MRDAMGWEALFVRAIAGLMERKDAAAAERLVQQALSLPPGRAPDGWRLAATLEMLALAQVAQGTYAEAEANLKRALETRVAECGPRHGTVARNLRAQARLYRAWNRPDKAAAADADATAI